MADDDCTCSDCQGNCQRHRNTEKCPKCGRDKLAHRQCYNCDAPTAFISQTGSEQPRAVPMFKRTLPRLPIDDTVETGEHIRAKPKAAYRARIRIGGVRRGKPSSFMTDELEVEVDAKASFREAWREVVAGDIHDISTLWDGIDDDGDN